MKSNSLVRKMNLWFVISLAVGLLLLVGGLVLRMLEVSLLEDNKAVVAVSIIPLALAAYYGITLTLMKRNPNYLRSVSVVQSDERITSLKHRADSITFQTMRWALTLVFIMYTFAFPSEIFESVGWWIVFAFFFLAHMMQGVVLAVLLERDQVKD